METFKKDSLSDKLESALFPVLFLVSMIFLLFGVVHTVIPGFWNELCAVVFLNLVCVFCIKGQEKIGILSIHLFSSLLLLYVVNIANTKNIEFGLLDSIARISFIGCLLYYLSVFLSPRLSSGDLLRHVSRFIVRLIFIVLFYGVFTNFGSNYIWIFSIPIFLIVFFYTEYVYLQNNEWFFVVMIFLLPIIISFISFWYQYWFQELIFGLLGWHIFVGLIVLFIVALVNVLRKI